MKILFCNKYNFPFSGTEIYLFELMELLRSQGHHVALFSMQDSRGAPTAFDDYFVPHLDFKNGNLGLLARAKLLAHSIYSTDARQRLRKLIAAFQPDIAHVRNIYHHLSPSILWELKSQRIPVIFHLNDFKILCPAYNFVSNGRACNRPCTNRFWRVMTHNCYEGGFPASAALMLEAYAQYWAGTYRKCIDHFLVPSQFALRMLSDNGFDSQTITVLPHFQHLPGPVLPIPSGAPILYFGRLSPEKGVSDLIRAMQPFPDLHLQIAGDGPQRPALEQLAQSLTLSNVTFLGHQNREQLNTLISRSRFTVLPSRAYETLGKSILESYALGRAVIASDLGSRREIVHDSETGLLYRAGDVAQLSSAISFLAQRPHVATEMGNAARRFVESFHSPDQHYKALTNLYTDLISRKQVTRQPTKPVRVAFIGGRGVVSKYSGIESYYEEVGKSLAVMGHEVTIYCRSHFTPAIGAYNGMRLVRLPTIRSKHLETFIHTFLSTIHAMSHRYDIVHFHALGPSLFSFLPRIVGQKTVVTVQGLDWQRKKWGRLASHVLKFGEFASARFPNLTMVVSKTLQQHYRDRYGIDTQYIPNGAVLRDLIPLSKPLAARLSPGYVLYLGRLSPEKNCHLLIQAYNKANIPQTLVLAGGSSHTTPYVEDLQKHAGPNIIFMDWVSGNELTALLTNADLFVLPSDMEGLSLALLDAMAAGVCVLTSDIPENREVVLDAGFTFRAGDVDDLARMLRLLSADREVRQESAAGGKQIIFDRYLWPDIARQIAESYRELLGRLAPSTSPATLVPSSSKEEEPALPASIEN